MSSTLTPRLWRLAAEASCDLLLVLDEARLVLEISPSSERLLGLRPDELVGRPLAELLHPEALLAPVGPDLPELRAQRQLRCKGQGHRWFELRACYLRDGQGAFTALSCFDVDERRRREELPLPEATERARAAGDGYVVVSDGRIVAFNERFAEIWGLPHDVLERGDNEAAVRLAMQQMADPQALISAGREEAWAGRLQLKLKDGRVLERYRAPLVGQALVRDGRIDFYRDVTAERRAEEQMRVRVREQEAVARLGRRALQITRAAQLMQEACALITEVEPDLQAALVFELQPGACELQLVAAKGWPVDQIGLLRIRNDSTTQAGAALLAGGPVLVDHSEGRFEPSVRVLREGFHGGASLPIAGRERPYGVLSVHRKGLASVTTDPLQFLAAVSNILADAVERERAEERLRSVFEHAPDAVVLSRDGKILYANQRLLDILLCTTAEVVGRPPVEFVHPDDRPHMAERGGQLESGGRLDFASYRLLRKNGETILVEASTHQLPGDGTQPTYVSVLRDITEREAIQARLQLSDRLASVGTLAAGAAHELNNPLAFLMGNLAWLESRLVEGAALDLPELREALRDAAEGAERMRLIVGDLKGLAASGEGRIAQVDVHAALETALKLAGNELRQRAIVVRELSPVPRVLANEGRLVQVFVNLLVNAAHAIPEGARGGTVVVATRSEGPLVIIEVADSGVGIPAELRRRIFDPFFTTKPVGAGTGLGLSIVHGIVSSMGGEITVESEEGRGTTFRVSLRAGTQPALSVEAEPKRVPGPRARILVVDDESAVGTMIRRLIGEQHEVVVLASAGLALERVAAGEKFDLLISDLLMPVMTGMELHAELTRVAPALAERMILMTGGAFTEAGRKFLAETTNRVLQKPFDAEALRAAVDAQLA